MSSSPASERKFRIALGLYAILAVVIWFTVGEGKVLVFQKLVDIRWIPLFVIAIFVFRTYMAREADKIRRAHTDSGEEDAGKLL